MKIVKAILGTILGVVAFFVVQGLTYMIITLLSQIPIIGAILYYPSDSSWALTVLPPSAGAFAGAWLAVKVGKTAMPMGIIIAAFYAFDIIVMFISHNFTWHELWMCVFTIIPAAIAMGMKEDDIKSDKQENSKSK